MWEVFAIKKTLKEIRLEHGLGQKFMSEQLGVSKPHYCNLENGNRRLSYGMAVKIAAVLNVPLQDIFFEKQVAKTKTKTTKAKTG